MSKNPRICPYYQNMTRQQITCTGIVPGCEIRQSFASPGMEKRNYDRFCSSNYHRCPTAQMLNTLHFAFHPNTCHCNSEVECLHPDECHRCGWSPVVARDRLERFLNLHRK